MMTRGNMILAVLTMASLLLTGAALGQTDDVTQGTLMVTGEPGKRLLQFPLEHTDVEADVTGLIAKVNVTQTFGNPYGDPIEAVYVFPLPENAAVNDMVMQVGDRTIRADIQTREQARETYEEAVAAGQRAALLEQERPNIFTQSVGNIMPGDEIEITITYVQDLKYDHGTYEFVFPMVVGPRFIPGQPVQAPWEGGGWAPDTDQVPDASRITPPVLTPDTRSGHDIDVHVSLNAGVPIQGLRCTSHEITSEEIDDSRADIKLHPSDTIPNKDFILKYDVMGEAPEFAFLPYHGPEGGFFLMMIQPKADYTQREITPKEMIFVVDCSGSMSGAPIETCKMAMKRCVSGMNGSDTFNVIKFSDAANGFADKPVANTSENVDRALEFIDGMAGTGGTQMIEGIKAALDFPHDPERLRIVFFMTDGYIGNETEILGAIDDKLGDARLFSLGVGSSVNRFLLEEMSRVGRGTVQYVRQDEEPGEVVERFYERIDKPFLTHIEVATEGVDLVDVYPDPIPDLFSAQPVTLVGRYRDSGRGTVRVEGRIAGEPWSTEIPVTLPGGEEGNDALASLWARKRIADLTASMYQGEDEATV
ncbi:MAG: VWA domain-containing protein, partial [Armatimonadia bacterium]|nr:VWA domain-containing protein [Armatimonadia bacterium]